MGTRRLPPPPGLDRVWAPWRNAFVSGPRPRGCLFCRARRSRADRTHHVVARETGVFSLLNRYPYTNGHVLIAPTRHVGRLEALRAGEWQALWAMTIALQRRLRRALRPDGFNVGINLGRSAGAGVLGHLHLHLVPRWTGDTNFMPITGHTKVISQSLDALYDRLMRGRRS